MCAWELDFQLRGGTDSAEIKPQSGGM